jgi:phosphoenolpyruvate-protein kinase (PTS system EI component)
MIAAFRSSWRQPALLITALWSLLRALNHWVDAAKANPVWIGWAEAALRSIVVLLLLGLAALSIHPTKPAQG